MIQQVKREITIRLQNKDRHFICINQSGIYEIKEDNKNNHKKLFTLNPNLHVKITKTEVQDKKYLFTVKFSENGNSVLGLIQGKQEIQKFLKVTGFYVTIHGFQQTVALFKKTGEGAFAQVYQVFTNYQNHFAVKSFQRRQLEKSQKSSKAFYNQIELMKKLNSPYIIPFQYIFVTDKAYYLKMQFLPKTLKQKISQKILVKEQKLIMRQLLKGLQQMKIKNVIHRDLKPQNIMLRINQKGQEECVIIDFGLATFGDAHQYIYFRCGTPGFLAPEIANLGEKNQKQACSADMFSLGCIFYKILTGHYLFPGKTPKQVLQANRKCIYSQHAFQKLSEDQKRLLLHMIDLDPQTRIKPEQALKDPYFHQNIDDNDQIPDQQCKVQEKVKKIRQTNTVVKSMDSIRSSLSIRSFTSQAYKEGIHSKLKDSCITFELRSKIDFDKETSLRRSLLSKSTNSKRTGLLSQRKSRFSQSPVKPQL